ncbi:polyadenylate-binding protein 3-like [Triplophysa rosa]|uniref:polyadenylate-binding protein 3-like n=1 Tax=Triplophysa rosa TaxID=992332 RepID=UPI0025462073|nr:polyadenylate-binding protein 3-like [Triplophysa rosa]
MDALMCQDLLGRPMRIMFSQRDSTLRTTGVGNVFIKGLASSIDGACLYDSFSRFGKILSCKVVCDANGSKGYGFVHFATFEAAEKAIKALDGMLLDDQLVSIGHFKTFEERHVEPKVMAQDNERHYPGLSLYVCNMPYSFSEQQLYRAFSPFGSIISAKLMMEAGRSRGFGFVSFFTLEDATTAATVMNGRMVAGRALRVTLSRHNEQKTQPEKQDSSSESLPAGQFTSAVPQVQNALKFTLKTSWRSSPSVNRQQRLSSLRVSSLFISFSACESLCPLMPVVLLDAVHTQPPRLLVSQVILDYWAFQQIYFPAIHFASAWQPRPPKRASHSSRSKRSAVGLQTLSKVTSGLTAPSSGKHTGPLSPESFSINHQPSNKLPQQASNSIATPLKLREARLPYRARPQQNVFPSPK